MPQDTAYIRVNLTPGMFANEYTVTFEVGGRVVTSTASVEDVKVEDNPSENKKGHGLLRVRLVQVDPETSTAVINLPQSSFTSEPRVKVPQEALVPA